MIRIILIRVLSLALLTYCAYMLVTALTTRKKPSASKKPDILESNKYDKAEWEKIKKELEKK